MWLIEELLLTIETGENLGTNIAPDFQSVANVFFAVMWTRSSRRVSGTPAIIGSTGQLFPLRLHSFPPPRCECNMAFIEPRIIPIVVLIAWGFALLPAHAVKIKSTPQRSYPAPPLLNVTSNGRVAVYDNNDTHLSLQEKTSCIRDGTGTHPLIYCQGEGEKDKTRFTLSGLSQPLALEIETDAVTNIATETTVCRVSAAEDYTMRIECYSPARDLFPQYPDSNAWMHENYTRLQKSGVIPPCSSRTSGDVQIQTAGGEKSASTETQTLIVIPRKNYQNNRHSKQSRDIKGNLTKHQRTHQVPRKWDKRFHCGTCDYATDRKGDLIKHQRTHQAPGERDKPFYCEYCDYATDHKGHLTVHQRTHQAPRERDKPFRCGTCNYATDLKSSLTAHQRTHQDPGGAGQAFSLWDLRLCHRSQGRPDQAPENPPGSGGAGQAFSL